MNLASAVTRDYLTDARIGKLPFMKLKKFLADNGVDPKEMSSASTKFALVAIAERSNNSTAALTPIELDAVAVGGNPLFSFGPTAAPSLLDPATARADDDST